MLGARLKIQNFKPTLVELGTKISTFQFQSTSKMSLSKRFFLNTLKDYQTENVIPEKPLYRSKILEIVEQILSSQPPNIKSADGGLYVGIGGISYMFYHLAQFPFFIKEKDELLKTALKYLEPSLKYAEKMKDTKEKSSFLLGNLGIYTVAAAVYKDLGDKKAADLYVKAYIDVAQVCKGRNFLRCGCDELFVGRAGYLCGAQFLNKIFGKGTVPNQEIKDISSAIVKSGFNQKNVATLMYSYYDVKYLGAAHGVSSILQMLLSFPEVLSQEHEQLVRKSVDHLLNLQTDSGNFPCDMEEVGSSRPSADELVHWCHGAPGVVYLMGRAYLLWKEPKYLNSCLRCGELVWNKGLLKKGSGICHGVAGSGYVFLLLFRLTGDPKHLHRAQMFADFMFTPEFSSGARRPDSPYSLYEGLAGTACYLADLLKPNQAAFPFFDIF